MLCNIVKTNLLTGFYLVNRRKNSNYSAVSNIDMTHSVKIDALIGHFTASFIFYSIAGKISLSIKVKLSFYVNY